MSGEDDGDGMFDPLSPEERRAGERAAPVGRKDEYTPVTPVPDDAPDPDWNKLRPPDAVGDPVGIWPYCTAEGDLASYTVRWNPKNPKDKKVIRPVSWCKLPDGSHGWALKAVPAPRPLYSLPDLLKVPKEEFVVVVEGEKCADAVAEAWSQIVAVTWSGGADAWPETDWEPVAGRDALLIADADDRGRNAMKALAAHLLGLGCRVRIYLPEGDAGDDIADWLTEDGIKATRERVNAGLTNFVAASDAVMTVGEAASSGGPDGGDMTTQDIGANALAETEPDGAGDWKSKLLKRVKGDKDTGIEPDPGAPFEPENLEKMLNLHRDSPDEWERLRAEFKARNVRVGALDRALARLNGDAASDGLQGRALEWPEPEPHPNPVDGSALLNNIAAFIRRYVDMRPEYADALALWIVHTWIHDDPRLEISTFLNITSATKRCGKSQLLEVVGELAYRRLLVGGRVTSAGLFRAIERHEPTLLLDEADTFFGNDPELRGIVNGSQRRDIAFVLRTVGDDHEPRTFRTWCPKAIAGIGGLPDTTLDRTLVVRLERRRSSADPYPQWRDRDRDAIQDMCGEIARWVADEGDAIFTARNKVDFPSGLHDRQRDAWEILLAIGDAAGGDWSGPTGHAWKAAQEIGADTADETGVREMLLADVRTAFKEDGDRDAMSTTDILTCLNAMDGRPWPEWRRGNELSARGMAKLLKPFGITPGTVRLDQYQTSKGYKRTAFVPVWTQYGVLPSKDPPAQSVTTSQVNGSVGSRDSQSVTSLDVVTDTKLLKLASSKGCDVVTDTEPPLCGEKADPAAADAIGDDIERDAIKEFDGSPSPRTTPEA